MTELDAINDLLEADTMLEQTIERWFDEATDKGLQQGMQQGMQQGEESGQQKGLIRAVSLQLQLRFGPVPDWAQVQLSAATEDQLLAWVEAILTAQSLQDLMRPGPQAQAMRQT